MLYFSLADTCERDSLTFARATSLWMTQSAVVAGLTSIKIHHNLLVHLDFILAGGKIGRASIVSLWDCHDCGSGHCWARTNDEVDGALRTGPQV